MRLIAVTALTLLAATAGRAETPLTHDSLMQRAAALRARYAAHPHSANATEPSLISGRILTPRVDVDRAPGAPIVSLNVDFGSVGVEGLQVEMVSPDNIQSVVADVGPPDYPPSPKRETIKIEVNSPFTNDGFGIFSESGNWTVSQVLIFGGDGQLVSYTGNQLAALFPSVTVAVTNHGKPDVTPPQIGTGDILTPSVSLSGTAYFAAKVQVSDGNAGVSAVGLSLNPPNGGSGDSAFSTLDAPVNNGKVTASALLQTGSPTGTYTISTVLACDAARNCTNLTTPAAIKAVFGTTTFQVTN